jgi:hypothetical protein
MPHLRPRNFLLAMISPMKRFLTVRAAGPRAGAAVLVALVGLSGCGSSSHRTTTPAKSATAPVSTGARTPSTTGTGAAASPAPAINELAAAEHPRASEFPAPHGRTLQQLATVARAQVQLGPATGVFTPGVRRVAFALNSSSGAFVYAPTALYVATSPHAKASGPYLAPADPMTVAAPYRSRQNSGPGGILAIYGAEVKLPHPGTYAVLALTPTTKGMIGSTGEIAVAARSPIPDLGQRPPDIATDTSASVHGDLSLLTTRIPPESMHAVSLSQALGKRPVALVISTPQLCVSRVCGPVTDIAVQLQREFGSRIAFIHQEVFVNNQPKQGLRPQLKAFHLQTEPWLFTVDRHGIIRARLEGAFGLNEARAALEAALR